MANSIALYTGDNTTSQFSVPFPYLSQSHVFAFVNNVQVSYTWISSGVIQILPAPAAGAGIQVQRITPTGQLVTFTDGSTLLSSDLNTSDLQTLYIAQETADVVGSKLGSNSQNVWDAQSKRLINLGEPTATTDAATKDYVDSLVAAAVATNAANATTTTAAAAAALTSQTNAAASAATATSEASIATSAANTATLEAGIATSAATTTAAMLASFSKLFLGPYASDAAAAAYASANSIPLVDGIMYENTTENKFRIYNGTAWQDYDSTAQSAQSSATLSATAAASSAAAAQTSQTAAAGSATSADTSATNAANSATAAATSATNASNSAASASGSASTSTTQATNASNSAAAAAASALSASGSATAAQNWATGFTIGTVTIGTPGATITGTAGNLKLNLVIPSNPYTLVAPTTSTLGGVFSATAGANQWMTGINSSGSPTFFQPAFSNISGMVAPGQLPVATSVAVGGVQAGANLTISGAGVLSLSSGNVTAALGYTPVNPSSLGTAASLTAGSAANNLVQLNASGQLPAVDGSLLTGIARSPVRQTVQAGDSTNGQASFLTVGTSLTPAFTAGTPLVLSFANGFSSNGASDKISVLSAGGSTAMIPANSQAYILATYLSSTSVGWGYSLAPPQYGSVYNQAAQACLQLNNNSLDDFGNSWTNTSITFANTSPAVAGTYYGVFNGTTSFMSCPTIKSINSAANGGWSLRGWAKCTTLPGSFGCIIGCATNYSFALGLSSAGKVLIYLSSTGSSWDITSSSPGSTTIATNAWHFYELTYDPIAGKYYVYVDGVLDQTVTSASKVTSTTALQVGSFYNANFFTGNIQCVEFLPYCQHPAGTTYTSPTTAPSVSAAGYASDWFDTNAMVLRSVSAASASAGANPTFTTSNKLYVGEATAGASSISSVLTYPFNLTGKYGTGITNAIGYGQTWQNVLASRAANTTYYNTTSKPILIALGMTLVSNGSPTLTINGVAVGQMGGGSYSGLFWYGQLSGIVPPGGNYSVSALPSTWAELR